MLINCYNLLLGKRDGSETFWEETKVRVHEKFDFMLTPHELEFVRDSIYLYNAVTDVCLLAARLERGAAPAVVSPSQRDALH